MSDAERQIDEAIEQAANPLAGEQIEGLVAPDDTARDASRCPAEAPPAEQPTESWSPPVPERTDEPAPFDAGGAERAGAVRAADAGAAGRQAGRGRAEDKKDDEGGSDWRTWSGRSINP